MKGLSIKIISYFLIRSGYFTVKLEENQDNKFATMREQICDTLSVFALGIKKQGPGTPLV